MIKSFVQLLQPVTSLQFARRYTYLLFKFYLLVDSCVKARGAPALIGILAETERVEGIP